MKLGKKASTPAVVQEISLGLSEATLPVTIKMTERGIKEH
jgi:hypothetical protein